MKKCLLAILLSAIGGETAGAHSAHTQVTEVEWNSVSGCFEVAMKLNAAALEDSVSIHTGRRFRLESSKHIDTVLARLMALRFRIDAENSSRSGTIRWAGHELQLHTVWLYFEYVPGGVHETESTRSSPSARTVQTANLIELSVENTCLMDVRPEVVHFIQFRHGNTVRCGHCSSKQPRTTFTEQKPVTANGITGSTAAQFVRVRQASPFDLSPVRPHRTTMSVGPKQQTARAR